MIHDETTGRVSDTLEYKLDIDIAYKALNKEVIDILHSNGIKINCWSCDDKEAAEKLSESGVRIYAFSYDGKHLEL